MHNVTLIRWGLGLSVATLLIMLSGHHPAAQSAGTLVNTSFDCNEWTQTSGADPCSPGDSINTGGNWTTSSGKGDQITLAANNPLGTGRGFRHWRGTGTNNNAGGIRITFTPTRELYVRWYARFSPGFAWTNGSPHYSKEVYFDVGSANTAIAEFASGNFQVHSLAGSQNIASSATWNAINGGSAGDGKFHCYEVYIKLDTNGSDGIVKLWSEGRLVGSFTGLNLGTRPAFDAFMLGSNQDYVTNGDQYTDYDDVVVSLTGPIGPLGSSITTPKPAAPSNVQIIR
jgi:hypothetical protein